MQIKDSEFIYDTRDFKLSEGFLEEFKGKQPKWGPLGYIVYKRTYSRKNEEGVNEEFWQTLKRCVEGLFYMQKQHCLKLGLPWDNNKAQRTAQDMYRRMWEFKMLPPGRGLWMLGTDHVEKHGSAALNNCFQYNTKIITKDGLKKIGDCVNTNQTLLTEGGKWISAPIFSFGKQRLWELTLSRNGITKTIETTKGHRWFCRDRRQAFRNKNAYEEFTTDKLRKGIHKLQSVYGQGIQNIESSTFGIAHGITFGDGTTVKNNRSPTYIRLCGDKDKQLLKYFNNSNTTQIENDIVVRQLPNYFKDFPNLKENKSYLLGWLKGYFAADGSCDINGQISLSSSKKENLEFVRDLCYIIGIGTYSIRKETRISNLTNDISILYSINFMRETLNKDFFLIEEHKNNYKNNSKKDHSQWTVIDIKETNREEEVYCAIVDGYGKFALEDNILTGNCAFISTESIDINSTRPFEFLMDLSMLGVGVSYDTKGADKIKIIKPEYDTTYIIPDSREGWVESLKILLEGFFLGKNNPTFDYTQIRPAGAPIKGFGGTSSGYVPLENMHKSIRELLNSKIGKQLSSVDIVDIMNLIAKCVVSGNVRRSATLVLGDADDVNYITMKQDKEKLYSHRWASNNSILGIPGKTNYKKIINGIIENGEPGIVWMENAQKYGRMKDPINWKDKKAMGTNPCSEQTLFNMELCCLVETFPVNHESLEDYLRTLELCVLYGKSITLVNTHWAETNAVMLKNRRMGISQSGIQNAIGKYGIAEILNWCDKGYEHILNMDEKYSDWLCIPKSIKLTSVKPSGTISLLPGVSSGIHYPHSEYYIRRIRFDETSEYLPILKEAGYKIEKDLYSERTIVVEFPVKEKFFTKGKNDVTVWEQFENAALYQHYWADNQVSITVTFKKEEEKDILSCLEKYQHRLKCISMLPIKDHGYKQAPYEEITKEQYEDMTKDLKKYNLNKIGQKAIGTKGCDGDSCSII